MVAGLTLLTGAGTALPGYQWKRRPEESVVNMVRVVYMHISWNRCSYGHAHCHKPGA